MDTRERKREWQRNSRRAFRERYGYSTNAHYDTDGLREQILARDGRRCVRCGMTDAEHRALWGRPITIDHINRDRRDNEPENLQTLCLRCHGSKDIKPELTRLVVGHRLPEILARREAGQTYQRIADDLGASIGAVWKWAKRAEVRP